MILEMTLPPTFGTNTLQGMLLEEAMKSGTTDPMEQMAKLVQEPIHLSLGSGRSPSQLAFIAEELQGLQAFLLREFGKCPEIVVF